MITDDILKEIDKINQKLLKNNKPYILFGFGRWGTTDKHLGLRAKWNNVNGAKVLIEATTENFEVDFSQGSHFFHNITSSNIGYLYINHKSEKDFIDWVWLNNQKIINDFDYVRHIRTNSPVIVRIDAKTGKG